MTIWERVQTALAGLVALPVVAEAYVPAATLPDAYIVYSLISSPPEQHAENAETLRSYRVQVSYYSRNGLASAPDTDTPMLAAGFYKSRQRSLGYSYESRHWGLATDYTYLEEV